MSLSRFTGNQINNICKKGKAQEQEKNTPNMNLILVVYLFHI
jgi:hypothetical protein